MGLISAKGRKRPTALISENARFRRLSRRSWPTPTHHSKRAFRFSNLIF
jgi:hypothetical protein